MKTQFYFRKVTALWVILLVSACSRNSPTSSSSLSDADKSQALQALSNYRLAETDVASMNTLKNLSGLYRRLVASANDGQSELISHIFIADNQDTFNLIFPNNTYPLPGSRIVLPSAVKVKLAPTADTRKFGIAASYVLIGTNYQKQSATTSKSLSQVANKIATTDSAPGEIPAQSLPVNFYLISTASQAEPMSTSEVNAMISDLNEFLIKNSFGKVGITASTYHVILDYLPNPPCGYFDTFGGAIQSATQYLIDNKQISSQGPITIAIIPENSSCNWNGSADEGAPPNPIIGEGGKTLGTEIVINGSQASCLVMHEFGHILGLQHASIMWCDSQDIVNGNPICASMFSEYGDKTSVMGNTTADSYSALSKSIIGWIDPSAIVSVTGSGSFSLDEVNSTISETGIKCLTILRGSTQDLVFPEGEPYVPGYTGYVGTFYTVEYREPAVEMKYPYDISDPTRALSYMTPDNRSSLTSLNRGIIVRLYSKNIEREIYVNASGQINPNHGSGLKEGDTFYDVDSLLDGLAQGMSLTVNQLNGTTANINISFGTSTNPIVVPSSYKKKLCSMPPGISMVSANNYIFGNDSSSFTAIFLLQNNNANFCDASSSNFLLTPYNNSSVSGAQEGIIVSPGYSVQFSVKYNVQSYHGRLDFSPKFQYTRPDGVTEFLYPSTVSLDAVPSCAYNMPTLSLVSTVRRFESGKAIRDITLSLKNNNLLGCNDDQFTITPKFSSISGVQTLQLKSAALSNFVVSRYETTNNFGMTVNLPFTVTAGSGGSFSLSVAVTLK